MRARGGGVGHSYCLGSRFESWRAHSSAPLPIRRQAWARLIKKVFEVDPLACPRCGAEMVVVAWIHEPAAIDRILTHRRQHGLVSPFDARAPPTT